MADYVAYVHVGEGPDVPIKDEGAIHRDELFDLIYPVGSIYMSVNNANPGTLFGGTWVAWGSGRVPVGVNTSDSSFNTVEKTGGTKISQLPIHSHRATFTGNAVSGHTHGTGSSSSPAYTRFLVLTDNTIQNEVGGALSGSGNYYPNLDVVSGGKFSTRSSTSSAGGHTPSGSVTVAEAGTANYLEGNLQPYITCYMWKRTA